MASVPKFSVTYLTNELRVRQPDRGRSLQGLAIDASQDRFYAQDISLQRQGIGPGPQTTTRCSSSVCICCSGSLGQRRLVGDNTPEPIRTIQNRGQDLNSSDFGVTRQRQDLRWRRARCARGISCEPGGPIQNGPSRSTPSVRRIFFASEMFLWKYATRCAYGVSLKPAFRSTS